LVPRRRTSRDRGHLRLSNAKLARIAQFDTGIPKTALKNTVDMPI